MIEKQIENHVDYDEIVDYVQNNMDNDIIVDRVMEKIDYSDIAEEVRNDLDIQDIADSVSEYINIDDRAESLLNSYRPGNGCGLGNAFTEAIKDGIVYLLSSNTELVDAIKTSIFLPNIDEIVERKMEQNFHYQNYLASKDKYNTFLADEKEYNQYILDREQFQKYLLEKKGIENVHAIYHPFGGTTQNNIA
jgi:hypothetical protein